MSPNRLVVIVEDNESVAASLAVAVESLPGTRALIKPHGEAALPLFLKDERVVALLTDFGLPGMDGLELIARVRAIPAYHCLPVMMITARELPSDFLPLTRPDIILPKPFSPKEVCRVLAALLK